MPELKKIGTKLIKGEQLLILFYADGSSIMFLSLFIFTIIVGTVAAREANVDNNRINLLLKDTSYPYPSSSHERRSVSKEYQFRKNAYDDYRSRHDGQSKSLRLYVPKTSSTKAPLKVHQPREDPRLFYQSDSYLKETDGQNVNHQASFIYPGKEVIRANEEVKAMPLRDSDRGRNMIDFGPDLCLRCPHDRTLITKLGSDRVLLQTPLLSSCSGHKVSRNVRFEHIYGPKFGSLLEKGSYMIIGRIMSRNRSIQLCKMQVHVVVQSCVTPKYLKAHCNDRNCSFTCQEPKFKLHGHSSLTCGLDLKWTGELPKCRAQTWCQPLSPPEHGRVSCKGRTAGAGPGLVEGSKCRVRCAAGWRWHPRAAAVCRRGEWTNTLACHTTNKI